MSCHGKIKRCLQQSAQESAFEQGLYYENCSNYIQTNTAWRMKMKKGPKIPQTGKKKKVVHAHKHARISSEQPGYFHIFNKKWQWKTNQAAKSCVVWALLLILKESTHSKTGNANVHERTHDALLQHIQSVDISSCAWHTTPSVLCMREGSLDRNVRGQDIPTGEQIFSLKSSVQWCNQHKKCPVFTLSAPLGHSRLNVFTHKNKKQKNGVPATSVPSKVSKGSGWGKELFWRYTGQRMFVNGGNPKALFTITVPPRVVLANPGKISLHILCRFSIRQGGRV